MSFSTRLKDATWASHRSAEGRAWQRALARGAADPARLALYLEQLRRVHAALETRLDADPAWAAALGWGDSMRHSARLERDLAQLAAGPLPALPAALDVVNEIGRAAAAEPAALIGFVYVLEGSMNGNRFILRALRRGPSAGSCGFAYFDPYGEQQPARWSAFKSALDRLALGPEEEAAAIAAALAAFGGVAAISEELMALAAPAPR